MVDVQEKVFLYDKHMPETDDVTLIVLKGHLLVENILFVLTESAFAHPQYLDSVRLSFHQLANIVRAAVPQRSDDPAWQLIFKLNSLRNDLAHKLESDTRQSRITELINLDLQVQPTPGMTYDKSGDSSLSEAERLRQTIVDCMEFLLSLSFDYDRMKESSSD